MKNIELQELLKQYPNNVKVVFEKSPRFVEVKYTCFSKADEEGKEDVIILIEE